MTLGSSSRDRVRPLTVASAGSRRGAPRSACALRGPRGAGPPRRSVRLRRQPVGPRSPPPRFRVARCLPSARMRHPGHRSHCHRRGRARPAALHRRRRNESLRPPRPVCASPLGPTPARPSWGSQQSVGVHRVGPSRGCWGARPPRPACEARLRSLTAWWWPSSAAARASATRARPTTRAKDSRAAVRISALRPAHRSQPPSPRCPVSLSSVQRNLQAAPGRRAPQRGLGARWPGSAASLLLRGAASFPV